MCSADSTDSGVRFLMDFAGKHDFVLGLTRKYLDTVTSLSDKCGSIITRSAVWQVREMLHHWAASHSVTVSRWALPPSPPPEQLRPRNLHFSHQFTIFILICSGSHMSLWSTISSLFCMKTTCNHSVPESEPALSFLHFLCLTSSGLYWALRHWSFLVLHAMGFSGHYFASTWNITFFSV